MVLPWVPPIRVQLTPPAEALLTFAASCAAVPFSAHPPGRIDSPPPLWYVNDHEEAIGQGRAEFVRAGDALRRLDCLQLDWLRATVQGDVLAICSRQFGVLWLMNANRLLPKAASDASGTDCVAMCWGTSTRHVREPARPLACLLCSGRPLPSRSQVLAGEERLSVRWDRDSDTVLFRVRSYSRPRHAFGLLGYPVVRLQQRRFARDAAQAMRRACTEG